MNNIFTGKSANFLDSCVADTFHPPLPNIPLTEDELCTWKQPPSQHFEQVMPQTPSNTTSTDVPDNNIVADNTGANDNRETPFGD